MKWQVSCAGITILPRHPLESGHPHLGLSQATVWDRAQAYLKQALAPPTPLAHSVAARWRVQTRQYEDAIAEAERAIALDPNALSGHLALAGALMWAGRAAEAVPVLERTMRLDPHYPASRLASLGRAYFGMEQYDKAVRFYERAIKRNPTLSHWVLAAAYAHLGRTQEAVDTLQAYQKVRGWPTLPSLRQLKRYYPYQHLRDWERLAEGLRQAGVVGFKREPIAQSLPRMFCAEKRLLQERTRAAQHLSNDVASRALLADTPAETAAARELAAGEGQAAFDATAAAWTPLAEQLGTPYVPIGKLSGVSCAPSASHVGRESAGQ